MRSQSAVFAAKKTFAHASLLLLIIGFLTIPEKALAASFAGTVRDGAQAPLPDVVVRLSGAVVVQKTTNAGGKFSFPDVPPGTYRASFSKPQYVTAVLRMTVGGNSHIVVILRHDASGLKIVGSVVSHERVPFNSTPAAVKVFPREAYRDQGQPSLESVIDQTAGVSVARSSAENFSEPLSPFAVVIRGSAPWQTAALIDGVPVSASPAASFNFALIPSFVVQDVEIVKGAGSAQSTFVNAAAGAVNIRTTEPGVTLRGMSEFEGDTHGGRFSDIGYGGPVSDGRFSFATMFAAQDDGIASQSAELLKARYAASAQTTLTATALATQTAFQDAFAREYAAPQNARLGYYDFELQSETPHNRLDARLYSMGVSGEQPRDDTARGFEIRFEREAARSVLSTLVSYRTGSLSNGVVQFSAIMHASDRLDLEAAAAAAWLKQGGRWTFSPQLRAGASLRVLANVALRASAGTAVDQAPLAASGDPLETATTYDAGAEYRLRGETTTLSADVYRTIVHGQYDLPLVTPLPPADRHGAEATLQQFKRVGLGFITQLSLEHGGMDTARAYEEISYKWPRGSRLSLGALYEGPNNPYLRPAFWMLNSNLELSLGNSSKLQLSIQNVSGVFPTRAPVPIPGGFANVAGPTTVRFMFRQSLGGPIIER